MKRALDITQQVFIEMKSILYVRFDCINKQQLLDFVQYVQKNVVARKMKIEYGIPTYIVLNDKENDYLHTHETITVPVHLADLEKRFPFTDFTIPFMMHVLPKTSQVVLCFNHMVADARYIFNLITSFEKNQQLPQELFDSPCSMLKPEIQQHKPITKYIEANNFKIPEPPNKLNCYTCRVTQQINELPHMKTNHTQRMSIISGLLKLRILQKEGLISYEKIKEWMATDGINTFLVVVMDARVLVKRFQGNYGNFISFYHNSYKLLKNSTVKEMVQKLREQLDDLKNQQQYLEHLGGVNPYTNSDMFEGIILSSFGNLTTPFKVVNLKQHAYDDKNAGVLFLYSYTINGYLTVLFQHNDQQAPYVNELRIWLTTLVQNCKDDITIEQLYQLLQ